MQGNDGASEAYQGLPSNILQGKTSLRITIDLHGLHPLGGDASAIIIDQPDWCLISLSNYAQAGLNGQQTVEVPLLAATRWRRIRARLEGHFDKDQQLLQSLDGLSRNQDDQEVVAWTRYEAMQMQGRLSEVDAEDWLGIFRRRVEASPELPEGRLRLMDVYRLLGRGEETRRAFEHFAGGGFAGLPTPRRSLARLAHSCAFLGDRERAAKLIDLLLPYAKSNLWRRRYMLSYMQGYRARKKQELEQQTAPRPEGQ